MKKIKTAVIGVGNMGSHHARIYSKISNLVAVCDVDSRIGRTLAKKYNVKFYSDYKEMLKKEQPEAVSIAVPTKFHSKIAVYCLGLKIPTMVEKPIAETLSEAKKIMKIAKENNSILMIGHIERFNPAIIILKKLINEGRFGSIVGLQAIRVGINPPRSANANVVLDLSIHDIDIFNFLLDTFPKNKKIISRSVFNRNISDIAAIVLEYPNSIGILQTNWITPIKIRRLLITGTKGYAEVDYIKQKLLVYEKPSESHGIRNYSEFIALSGSPKKEIFISRKEPLREELLFFLNNRNNQKAFDFGFSAYKALEILLKN